MVARFFILCSLFFLLVFPALSQDEAYSIGDDVSTLAASNDEKSNDENALVRLAYFSFVSSEVLWRIDRDNFDASPLPPGSETNGEKPDFEWARASVNLPLRAGMEVLVPIGGKAELCFDDGSLVRLGSNSHLALETLTSDSDSEFTSLRLDGGLVTLKLKNPKSAFQVQAASTSIRARGPASIRIGASTLDANSAENAVVEIAVRAGRAFLENETGTFTLRAGQFLKATGNEENFSPRRLPAADSWESWDLARDEFWQSDSSSNYQSDDSENPKQNLPENLELVSGDLDRYGDWRDDAQHGRVWQPRVSTPDWRPYNAGRWNWVFPFGWTWVSDEPWGWAPYHYGTWINCSYGWAWVPGPAYQPWCPGVVNFFERNGQQCWAPLSPSEVRYPRYNSRPRWSFNFSIGSAACYVPSASTYCEPRAWSTPYVNYVTNITYVTYVTKIKKEKKIVYRCPHETKPRVCIDGAPDDHFDQVFPHSKNGSNKNERDKITPIQNRPNDRRAEFRPRHALDNGATTALPVAFDAGSLNGQDDKQNNVNSNKTILPAGWLEALRAQQQSAREKFRASQNSESQIHESQTREDQRNTSRKSRVPVQVPVPIMSTPAAFPSSIIPAAEKVKIENPKIETPNIVLPKNEAPKNAPPLDKNNWNRAVLEWREKMRIESAQREQELKQKREREKQEMQERRNAREEARNQSRESDASKPETSSTTAADSQSPTPPKPESAKPQQTNTQPQQQNQPNIAQQIEERLRQERARLERERAEREAREREAQARREQAQQQRREREIAEREARERAAREQKEREEKERQQREQQNQQQPSTQQPSTPQQPQSAPDESNRRRRRH